MVCWFCSCPPSPFFSPAVWQSWPGWGVRFVIAKQLQSVVALLARWLRPGPLSSMSACLRVSVSPGIGSFCSGVCPDGYQQSGALCANDSQSNRIAWWASRSSRSLRQHGWIVLRWTSASCNFSRFALIKQSRKNNTNKNTRCRR